MAARPQYTTIDEYIATFPDEIQERMQMLRNTIKEQAPDATEKISWAMPTFWLNGNLVHFAGHKFHIGFYPGGEAVQVFEARLKEYKTSKGAIQFPNDRPLPLELVREIVKYRVAQQG